MHQQHKVCGGGFCSLKESTSNVLKGRLEEVIQGIFYFGLKSLLTDVAISQDDISRLGYCVRRSVDDSLHARSRIKNR